MILKHLDSNVKGTPYAVATELTNAEDMLVWLIFISNDFLGENFSGNIVTTLYREVQVNDMKYYETRANQWINWIKLQRSIRIIQGWEKVFLVSDLDINDFMRSFAIGRPNASISILNPK